MMLKNRTLGTVMAAAVCALIWGCESYSCGPDAAALITNMEKLIEEAQQKDFPPKSRKWERYDDRFRFYYEECYDRRESEMKGREKRKFAGLVSRYVTIRYGGSFFKNLFKGKNEDEPENLPDLLEKFLNDGVDD